MRTTDFAVQIESVVAATQVTSSTGYSWFGSPSTPLPRSLTRRLDSDSLTRYLVQSLQAVLYSNFYCTGWATPIAPLATQTMATDSAGFISRLSVKNVGTGSWQGGWRVIDVTADEVVLKRGQLTVWVSSLHLLQSDTGERLAPGDHARLRYPKELRGASPGFYLAVGNRDLSQEDSQELVRYYWSVSAEGAPVLVELLTGCLNRGEIPFRLKVLNSPSAYTRCDAGVLYVPKRMVPMVNEQISEIYQKVEPFLKWTSPALTKPLAPGLSLAEDPGSGDSFGMDRCALIASALVSAHQAGYTTLAGQLGAIDDAFSARGISKFRPYLTCDSDHSDSQYRISIDQPALSAQTVIATATPLGSDAYLDAAVQLGARLIDSAFWHDTKCTWLADDVEVTPGLMQPEPVVRTLTHDLYQGTSGIALFLGELYSVTGETKTRDAALGALANAMDRVGSPARLTGYGIYTGLSGVSLVAIRLGHLLCEESLVSQGIALLRTVSAEHIEGTELDFLSGIAGLLGVLLSVNDMVPNGYLVDTARQLGDRLIDTASKSQQGFSWPSVANPKQRHLTGMSHGASGIAHSLHELAVTLHDSKYQEGADQGFAYENFWFNPDTANWPDFRSQPARGPGSRRLPTYRAFWCHGAPGIAISRLRAYELHKRAQDRKDALTALETTKSQVAHWLHSRTGNYSLCHGLLGNAETLMYASEILGQEVDWARKLAFQIADTGITNHLRAERDWPCGTATGEVPGLMLGLAGIGHFYLRLYDQRVPSVLRIQRGISR